ncbi:MAG: hypothetical protein OXG27_14100 [Chloroflexi bacterium]|nr:hypothetical protein [Chloroflexota bacterium]
MSTQGAERVKNPLQEEFEHYLANQDSFVEEYDGKVIVIKDCQVVGVYESELEAINEAKKEHELGTFLVQRVSAGSEGHTLTIHRQVAF